MAIQYLNPIFKDAIYRTLTLRQYLKMSGHGRPSDEMKYDIQCILEEANYS